MLSKSNQNKKIYIGLIVLGILSIIFGTVFQQYVESTPNLKMTAGMIAGVGGAFVAIGVIRLIKFKKSTPEKLKAEEIELKDERNIQILRATYSVVAAASILIFAIMAFVFLLLDYMVPAWIAISGIYVEVIIFSIAYKIISSKM